MFVEPSVYKADRFYPDSLNLSNLPPSSNIVLFTPVILPVRTAERAGPRKNTKEDFDLDPFEPLGVAISAYHERVRHVPYLLTDGYTETHATFLNEADVVVVVVCQPWKKYRAYPDLSHQMDFANEVREDLKKMEGGKERELVLVLILGRAGDDKPSIRRIALKAETTFRHFFRANGGYDDDVAEEIAEVIFEDEGSATDEDCSTVEDTPKRRVEPTVTIYPLTGKTEIRASHDLLRDKNGLQWMDKALRLY